VKLFVIPSLFQATTLPVPIFHLWIQKLQSFIENIWVALAISLGNTRTLVQLRRPSFEAVGFPYIKAFHLEEWPWRSTKSCTLEALSERNFLRKVISGCNYSCGESHVLFKSNPERLDLLSPPSTPSGFKQGKR